MYMVPKTLANALNFIEEMTCTEMDITMKNLYLDLFQRLIVGAFTGYVTFEKGRDPETTWPFTNSSFRTCRS